MSFREPPLLARLEDALAAGRAELTLLVERVEATRDLRDLALELTARERRTVDLADVAAGLDEEGRARLRGLLGRIDGEGAEPPEEERIDVARQLAREVALWG